MTENKIEKRCANCGVIIMYETKSDLCHLCTPLTKKDVEIPRIKKDKKERKDDE